MRVAIVGCGVEGSALAGGLMNEAEVTELVLVSRDGKRAETLRTRLAGAGHDVAGRVECRAADANDTSALNLALAGVDVVANAALPDSNLPVMRACLTVGAHYLDMLAIGFEMEGVPREQTLDGCLDLDAEYRSADLVAIPNTGAAPGVTDVLTRYLASGLDTTDSALVGWADRSNAADLLLPFTPELAYLVCMPAPAAWRDGRLVELDLFETIETLDWPGPLGRMTMISGCIDPELRTLQYVVPGARHIQVKTGLAVGRWGGWLEIWAEGVRRVIASGAAPAGVTGAEWLAGGFAPSADYAEALESRAITENSFGIFVRLTGTVGAQMVTRSVTVHTTLELARAEVPWSNAMAHLTAQSTPRQIILLLGRGQISERGVVPSVGTLAAADRIAAGLTGQGFVMREEVATSAGARHRDGIGASPLEPPG